MNGVTPARIFRFGVFELNSGSGELRRHGLKVRLPDQALQILLVLLSRPGEVVTRDELRRVLWPADTFVDFEVGLNSAVRKLREALDDSADNPRFVETLPRRGHRFIATVIAPPVERPPFAAPRLPRPHRGLWLVAGVMVAALLSAAWFSRRPPPALAARVDARAYAAYLDGTTAMGLQRAEGFQKAVTYFEQAVALQPDFAEAYASLANAQMQLLFGGPLSPHEVIPKAEAAARRAMQLDDSQPLPHRILGQILCTYHWRCEEGDQALQRGIERQPDGSAELDSAIGMALLRRGRFAEAIARFEAARDRDPLSLPAQIAVGRAYVSAGQHVRARREFQQALQMSPGHNRVQFHLGVALVALGRFDEAIRELEAAAKRPHSHNSRFEGFLGYAYAAAGRDREARAVLAEMDAHRRDQYVSWFGVALIHDALGDQALALAALQRAFDDHAVEFSQMDQYPPFRTIETEPAFAAVMRRVGRAR